MIKIDIKQLRTDLSKAIDTLDGLTSIHLITLTDQELISEFIHVYDLDALSNYYL